MSDGDQSHDDDALPEPGTIGVGMGGSCPVCRAPVDLGQEFCLECGSPIRFTPRQRRQHRPGSRPGVGAAVPVAPRRSGFPWIPFLVVLALVGGGVAFALVDDDDRTSGSGSKGSKTEPALPEITNSVPDDEGEPSEVTLQDCDPNQPLGDTRPAVTDGTGTDPSLDGGTNGTDTIPEIGSNGTQSTDPTGDPFGDPDAVPSIEPDAGSDSGTATVDQDGFLCDSSDGTGDPAAPTDPNDPDTSSTATTSTNTTATSSGDWPSGTNGWTVIVAGYPNNEARATQRAADVQEDGYDDSGVLFSTDFPSLCAGYHVVYSGVFDSERQANARLAELEARSDYAGMYVRQVSTTGPAATGCTAAR